MTPSSASAQVGVAEGDPVKLATRIDGDRALGEQILGGLAYMI